MYELTIPGKPTSQSRPRVTKWGAFNPNYKEKKAFEAELRELVHHEPLSGPISVSIDYFIPIPVSYSKKKRREIIELNWFHFRKPDIDNLVVFTLNCMTGIVYIDDSQIRELHVKKAYSDNPRTQISYA